MQQSNSLIGNGSARSERGRAERERFSGDTPLPKAGLKIAPAITWSPLEKWEGVRGNPDVPRARPHNSALVAFIGVLMRHRYPRRPSAMAAEIGVSKATAYRYIAEIERQSALPLARAEDPATGKVALVGVDWERMRSWR